MTLIICGHQRSGTSLLYRLIDHHPAITITNEFGNFFHLNESFADYRNFIWKRWWETSNRSYMPKDPRNNQAISDFGMKVFRRHSIDNFFLVSRYLRAFSKQGGDTVDLSSIEKALKSIFSGVSIVGDKYPDYVFSLKRFIKEENLTVILVYRDPRDVASSVLTAYRTLWKKWWGEEMGSAEKIAERWVRVIDIMLLNSNRVIPIKYEELVTNPQIYLEELGEKLQVDWKDFDYSRIHSQSIGKHRKVLTSQECDAVIRVAGSKMEALGYKL